MPSPFPGMNPYLEQDDTWEDFHQSFITHARDVLSGEVGEHYLVKVEVRLFIHELSAEERLQFARADVGITTPARQSGNGGTSTCLEAAPLRVILPAVELQKHSWIHILDRRNRRVVTALELLSPANKQPGHGQGEYLTKRAQLLASDTHFVEIDLRRGGRRPSPPDLPACDYYVLVSRAEDRPAAGFWPIRLREPLPRIPIPLLTPDPDVSLDLQALLHRVYDAADYGKYIYDERPDPPLGAEDEAWARRLIGK